MYANRRSCVCTLAAVPFFGNAGESDLLCGSRHALSLGSGFHLGEVLRRPPSDFDDLVRLGARSVRFGIRLSVAKNGEGYEWPFVGIQALDDTLREAARCRLSVILVLRPPPEPTSILWRSESFKKSLEIIWAKIAERYNGVAVIAAYDLVNEPHPPGSSFALKEMTWADLATRLILRIREVDSSRLIVYEPSPGARPMAFRYVKALPFEGIVYSVHLYEPFEYTHQRIGDPRFTSVVDFPGLVPGLGIWDAKRIAAELELVRDFGSRSRVHINVGEFGAVRWAPNASREAYLAACTQYFNAHGWSWHYHAFREWHGWDAEMNADSASRVRNKSEGAMQVLKVGLARCKT